MASDISIIPWEASHEGVDPDKQKWELYDIEKDFSQADDLAASRPDKLREMQDLWWAEAAKHDVLPMDWRIAERMNSELAGRPSLSGDAKTLTYYAGQIGLPPEGSPRVLNKSWTLKAELDVPASGAEGMIVTQGGPKDLGKGAVVTMSINGAKVAEGRLPRTIPAMMGIGEGMDVGSPVDFTYKPPFKFTGTIEKVTFTLK
jgi:arylsulfatase